MPFQLDHGILQQPPVIPDGSLGSLGRIEAISRLADADRQRQADAQADALISQLSAQYTDRPDELVSELRRRGFARQAMGLEEHLTKQKKALADVRYRQLEADKLAAEVAGTLPDQKAKKIQVEMDLIKSRDPKKIYEMIALSDSQEDLQEVLASAPFLLPQGSEAIIATLPKTWSPDVKAWGARAAMGAEAAGSQDLRKKEIDAKAAGVGGSESDFGSFLTNFMAGEAAKLGKTPEELGPSWRAGQTIKARKEYGQADDAARRPLAPIVVMTPQGPMVTTGTDRQNVAPIMGPDGKPIALPPTAEQRNRAAGMNTGKAVIDSIDELSAKINTQSGVIAKISGAAEKAKASANLNDDVAEYNALVSGFVPLLARAVGHVGVLTEQDVQSVKDMLPKVGDSQSLRDRKMARIRKIMAQMPGGGDAGTSTATSGPKEGDVKTWPSGMKAVWKNGQWHEIK